MIEDYLSKINNKAIFDSFIVAHSKLTTPIYERIMVNISGGRDSDVVLDLIHKLDINKKCTYVFFDTGVEYQATKNHLAYLEEKYNIQIVREKAAEPVALACKKRGLPFISKRVSDYIMRLQNHGFSWTDESFEELYKRFPKCKAALRWWCDDWGEGSKFNIGYHKYLKEFMIMNPPQFHISQKCCKAAKKDTGTRYKKEHNIQLCITGVRKAERGARASAYKNCFTHFDEGCDEYRPLFWYSNKDIQEYHDLFNIKNSLCYTDYGLKRTGCVGCPFGIDFEKELEIVKEHEPKLYKACNNIFKDSYEYMRDYRAFRKEKEGMNK